MHLASRAKSAKRRRCADIVDDEQRRGCPQCTGAQRVSAMQAIRVYRRGAPTQQMPLRRSKRGPLYFHHGLLGRQTSRYPSLQQKECWKYGLTISRCCISGRLCAESLIRRRRLITSDFLPARCTVQPGNLLHLRLAFHPKSLPDDLKNGASIL